jgi:hypothetical protein
VDIGEKKGSADNRLKAGLARTLENVEKYGLRVANVVLISGDVDYNGACVAAAEAVTVARCALLRGASCECCCGSCSGGPARLRVCRQRLALRHPSSAPFLSPPPQQLAFSSPGPSVFPAYHPLNFLPAFFLLCLRPPPLKTPDLPRSGRGAPAARAGLGRPAPLRGGGARPAHLPSPAHARQGGPQLPRLLLRRAARRRTHPPAQGPGGGWGCQHAGSWRARRGVREGQPPRQPQCQRRAAAPPHRLFGLRHCHGRDCSSSPSSRHARWRPCGSLEPAPSGGRG